MEVSVAHTPDADDAFMFYGIASNRVKSALSVRHVIADIETLNRRALDHELDVTAVSAHAYAYLNDYVILRSGGSFGLDYGPVVLAKKAMTQEELRMAKIAVPGKLTSAYLLLMLAIGKFDAQEMSFENIPEAVDSGRVDAGLVIHEAQITFDKTRFVKVLDLGKWWSKATGGLPVPLGINVASRRSMTQDQIMEFSDLFTRSIRYGLEHIDEAIDYAMRYSRGQ
jgi:1,4-dihydroxy-6-naphthoate synthase